MQPSVLFGGWAPSVRPLEEQGKAQPWQMLVGLSLSRARRTGWQGSNFTHVEGNLSSFGLSSSGAQLPGASAWPVWARAPLSLIASSAEECQGRLWDELEAHCFETWRCFLTDVPPPRAASVFYIKQSWVLKWKGPQTAYHGILHPLDQHLQTQSCRERNVQHPPASFSGCQHTGPQPVLGLWGKRQLLPPSFPTPCPNEFQTGFSHHVGTLSNAARCRVRTLSGYYCVQLNFFPPHPQAQGFTLLNSFGQTHSLTVVQSVSNWFWYHSTLHYCVSFGGMDSWAWKITCSRHCGIEMSLITATWRKRQAEWDTISSWSPLQGDASAIFLFRV